MKEKLWSLMGLVKVESPIVQTPPESLVENGRKYKNPCDGNSINFITF
jgi:hypothetical protein